MILLLLVACGSPTHLQYDHGRAYWQSMAIQADTSRPSVSQAVYPLTGEEAIRIRHNVEESTTNEETGRIEQVSQ